MNLVLMTLIYLAGALSMLAGIALCSVGKQNDAAILVYDKDKITVGDCLDAKLLYDKNALITSGKVVGFETEV